MTPWRIVADETGTCNCAWGCPCQFNALSTYGRCEAHRALIELPNGFEYKEAEMANCLEHYAKLGDKVLSNKNCYAQFAAVDWSNA